MISSILNSMSVKKLSARLSVLLVVCAFAVSAKAQESQTYPVVVGLGNDSYVITVNAAGQLASLLKNVSQTGVRSAKTLKIVCEGNAQLSSVGGYLDDNSDLGNLMNLSTLETLNLEEAKVQNLSSKDYTNPSPVFALSNSLKSIIFPIQDGMYLERINNNCASSG